MIDVHFGAKRRYPELERLICAAVSNQHFASQLIAAPELALEQSGHGRKLSPSERALVVSIRGVVDIYEFAAQLYARAQSLAETVAPDRVN
jgi:hypothetical protein